MDQERLIIQVVGQVMVYDSNGKQWHPAGTSSGLSTVRLIHYLPSNIFRIHGQRINELKEVVLDSQITREVKYNRPNETFIQWHDSQGNWGLNFRRGLSEAESFFGAIIQVLKILNQNTAQPSLSDVMTNQQHQSQSQQQPQPQQNSAAIIQRTMQQQQLLQHQQQQQQAAQQSMLHQQQQPQIMNQQQSQTQMIGQSPPAQLLQQQPNQQQQQQQQLLQQQQLHQHYMQQQAQGPPSQQQIHNHINHYQPSQQHQPPPPPPPPPQQQLQQQHQPQQQPQQMQQQIAPIVAAPIPPPPPPPPAPPAMNNCRINGTSNSVTANNNVPPMGNNLQHSPIASNNFGAENNVSRNSGSPNQTISLASELAKCQLRKVNLSRSNSDKESECNNNHISNAKTTRAASLAPGPGANLMNQLHQKIASRRERIDQQGDNKSMSSSNGDGNNGANTNGIGADKVQESWLADLIRKEISKEITKMKTEIIDAIKTELRQR